MSVHDMAGLLTRIRQLNSIAYALILALAAIAGLLLYAIMADLQLPTSWVLANHAARVLSGGFAIALTLYLWDKQRSLRRALEREHEALEKAVTRAEQACLRTRYALDTAAVMASSDSDGLSAALDSCALHFDADVCAIVGDEITEYAAVEDWEGVTEGMLARVAVEAVSGQTSVNHETHDPPGHVIAVPLRVEGRLEAVLCVWRHDRSFEIEATEGLELVGTIVELGIAKCRTNATAHRSNVDLFGLLESALSA